MKSKIKTGIIVAVGELFLKSEGVKKLLTRRLIGNFSYALNKENIDFRVHDFRGRFFVETEAVDKAIEVLGRIFGLSWFAPATFIKDTGINVLKNYVSGHYQVWIKEGETFALRVRRDKEIKHHSIEIIDVVADCVTNRTVKLDNPDKEIFIEGRKNGWFVYHQKQKALGGLPVGSQGKVLSMISGGIDSPVSSFLMAKRGAENVWIHFHSFPVVSKKSIEKIKDTACEFIKFQPRLKVYFVPFSELQTAIKLKVPTKHRVLIYRRLMLKIAKEVARKDNCQALVTGESLGQVSSQTLTNLNISNNAVKDTLVLRPLIGMDKEEIIKIANKINTLDISNQPHEDCCTLFVPKHQSAEDNLERIEKCEKALDLDILIAEAVKKIEIEVFE